MRPGLSPFREKPPENNYKDRTMPRFRGELEEGEERTHRRRGTHDVRNPQGLTGTWVQAEGGKGGNALAQVKEADTGMHCRVQGQAAEAGGWQVSDTPRWAVLCTGRGGGEQVKREGFNDERLSMGRR